MRGTFLLDEKRSRMMLHICLRHSDLLMSPPCTGPDCSCSGENSGYKTHTVWALTAQNQPCSWFCIATTSVCYFNTGKQTTCATRDPREIASLSLPAVWSWSSSYWHWGFMQHNHVTFVGILYVIQSEIYTEMYLLLSLWLYSAYCKCSLWEAYR